MENNDKSAVQFDLILFDLDGTLVATAAELAAALNDTLQATGRPVFPLAQITDWIGHGANELLVCALATTDQCPPDTIRQQDFFPDIVQMFRQNYRQRCGTDSYVYPHVLSALSRLRAHGIALTMITNKEQQFADAVLTAHQLPPYFDLLIYGDSFPRKKPDPVGILHAMRLFNITSDRTLLIGDSSVDVATARAANISVWTMRDGYNMGQDITESHPDRLLETMQELFI